MADSTTFRGWFDAQFRRDGEPVSRAMARLQIETGLGQSTIYYAYQGARVQPEVALRIEALTGGRVLASDLVLAPSRKEVKLARTGTAG